LINLFPSIKGSTVFVYCQATNIFFTVVPYLRLFLDTLRGHHGGALIKFRPQREDFEEGGEKKKKMLMSGTWMFTNIEGNITHSNDGNCWMEKRQT